MGRKKGNREGAQTEGWQLYHHSVDCTTTLGTIMLHGFISKWTLVPWLQQHNLVAYYLHITWSNYLQVYSRQNFFSFPGFSLWSQNDSFFTENSHDPLLTSKSFYLSLILYLLQFLKKKNIYAYTHYLYFLSSPEDQKWKLSKTLSWALISHHCNTHLRIPWQASLLEDRVTVQPCNNSEAFGV